MVIKLFEKACESFSNARLDEALEICEKIFAEQPKFDKAYQLTSIILISKNQYELAIKKLKSAIDLFPDNLDLKFNLAYCYQQSEHFIAAISIYKELLTKKYNLDSVLFNIAVVYSELSELAQAKLYYEKLLTVFNEHQHGLYNYANLLQKTNDYKKSIDIYTKLLKLNSNFTKAWNNLGICYQNIGDIKKAIECYNKQIATEPNNVESYNNLGALYIFENELDIAEEFLKQAITINSNHKAANKNLAQIYMHKEDYDLAREFFNKVLAIDQEDTTAIFLKKAILGENLSAPPKEYIAELFDQYASSFDNHLLDKLEYLVPKTILAIVTENIENLKDSSSYLDLGCGTGIILETLYKNLAFRFEHSIGVDISKNMLNQAKAKNCYDALHQADIIDYLSAGHRSCSFIVAADVFPYIGDLAELFELLAVNLINNGHLMFSIETHNNEADYVLHNKGRFSHGYSYINELACANNFELLDCKHHSIRKNGVYTVPGVTFLYKKTVP